MKEHTKRIEFELYERLTKEEKIHLLDFEIINSIRNSSGMQFTQDEEERLLDIIKDVWLHDDNSLALSTIGDIIVEAYSNKEISLETLERSNRDQTLNCIEIGSFEDLCTSEEEEEDER